MSRRMESPPDRIVGNDMAEMVLIPAGEFEMGDPFNEGTTYRTPRPRRVPRRFLY